ncbi:hypothetical protein [Intestinibacter sp.]|uniref:hypothetical protein n=1 Tax=Intestinibacter sp. TaxID=1965304 RepID=UPI002A9118DC|nr:hypothetical protein [Intestinibacter sp.]MDY5211708.1 hypothetical protein [Intestinibacter sp.]
MKIKQNIKTLILITAIVLSITGCSNEEVNTNNDNSDTISNIEQTQSDKENTDLPNYKVALVDDANIGNVIRETLHIVVDGDYTLEQLNTIAEKEALAYVKQNKVNALAVGFYEDENNIGKGYDMGRVEYVPYGDWAKAIDVKAGDYSNFEFVNYLQESISSSLPQGTSITEDKGETDINLVKSDIEGVNDGLDVNVTKKGDVLVINVVETQDAMFPANELTISAYTDWCLDNIKSDIKSIDFTVETNNGTVRALLDTSKVETSNGRYFDSNYIAKNIQK